MNLNIYDTKQTFKMVQLRTILQLALLAGSLIIGIVCTIFMNSHNNHGLFVSKSVHVYENTEPRSYFALDWTMRPQHDAIGRKVISNMCVEDSKNCSAAAWQLETVCPQKPPGSALTTTWTYGDYINDVNQYKALFSDETNGKQGWWYTSGSNAVTVKSAKEWQYLIANCKLERLSEHHTIPNSSESFGMFGSHSHLVLTWFVYLIFFVLAIANLFRNMKTMDNFKQNEYLSGNTFAMIVGVIFLFVLGAKLFTESIITENGTEFIRNSPNSSYMYGFFYLLLISFYYVIHIKDEFELETVLNLKAGEVSSDANVNAQVIGQVPPMNTFQMPPGFVLADGSDYTVPGQVPVINPRSQSTPLNLDFNNQTLSTGLKSTNRTRTEATIVNLNDKGYAFMLRKHEWTMVQFFVLPLWLLAIHFSAHGVVLDVQIQTIFVASVVYCILDIYLYNYQILRNKYNTLFAMQQDTTMRKFANITASFLAISVFQLVLIILLNRELDHHEMVDPDNHFSFRYRTDKTGIIFFNVWVALAFLGKLYENVYNTPGDNKYRVTKKRFYEVFNNLDEVLQFIFITIVFIALALNIAYHYNDHNYILSPITRTNSDVTIMDEILALRTQWAAKMPSLTA